MDQIPHVTIWLVIKGSNGDHGTCTLVACATLVKYTNGWSMNPYYIYYPIHIVACNCILCATYLMQLGGLIVTYNNWKWHDFY